MPFGFGKKKEDDKGQEIVETDNSIQPLDNDNYKEIEKIKEMLNPYENVLGIKENIIDIPYDVITSVKLEKGLFTSAIRFEAPALVGPKKLGMIKGIVQGEND